MAARKSTTTTATAVPDATPYVRRVKSCLGDGQAVEIVGPAESGKVGTTVYVSTRKSRDGKGAPIPVSITSHVKTWTVPDTSIDALVSERWSRVSGVMPPKAPKAAA